ncbi:unnamed protein product [Pedinophyceae sp. YPF-701]|nr:unnamed protein product [Pedinophyceae sp. YPF-701]
MHDTASAREGAGGAHVQAGPAQGTAGLLDLPDSLLAALVRALTENDDNNDDNEGALCELLRCSHAAFSRLTRAATTPLPLPVWLLDTDPAEVPRAWAAARSARWVLTQKGIDSQPGGARLLGAVGALEGRIVGLGTVCDVHASLFGHESRHRLMSTREGPGRVAVPLTSVVAACVQESSLETVHIATSLHTAAAALDVLARSCKSGNLRTLQVTMWSDPDDDPDDDDGEAWHPRQATEQVARALGTVAGLCTHISHLSIDVDITQEFGIATGLLAVIHLLASLEDVHLGLHSTEGWVVTSHGGDVLHASLAQLARLPRLKALSVACGLCDDEHPGGSWLAALTGLELLALEGFRIHLPHVRGLSALRRLRITANARVGPTLLDDAAVAAINALTSLEVLELKHVRCACAPSAELDSPLTTLTMMDAELPSVDGATVIAPRVATLPNLRHLAVEPRSQSDDVRGPAMHSSTAQELSLLADRQGLRTLQVRAWLTPASWREVCRMHKLATLAVGLGAVPTGRDAAAAAGLTSLRSLGLMCDDRIQTSALDAFAASGAAAHRAWGTCVGQLLTHLPPDSLSYLRLVMVHLSPVACDALLRFPQLATLELAGAGPLTVDMFSTLAACAALEHVRIESFSLNEGVRGLISAWGGVLGSRDVRVVVAPPVDDAPSPLEGDGASGEEVHEAAAAGWQQLALTAAASDSGDDETASGAEDEDEDFSDASESLFDDSSVGGDSDAHLGWVDVSSVHGREGGSGARCAVASHALSAPPTISSAATSRSEWSVAVDALDSATLREAARSKSMPGCVDLGMRWGEPERRGGVLGVSGA